MRGAQPDEEMQVSTPPSGIFNPYDDARSAPQPTGAQRSRLDPLERIRAIGERSADRFDRFQPSMTADERDFVRAARAGDLGPQWQRTQERIDAGESSLEDVIQGRDTSPDAEQIRATPLPTLAEVEAASGQRDAPATHQAHQHEHEDPRRPWWADLPTDTTGRRR